MRKHTMRMACALACAAVGLSGCLAAAGAAAGAGAVVYRQDQIATTTLQASLGQVAAWTESAFADMGITVTKTETESDEREITGEDGDLTVKVKLEAEGGSTAVTVVAARNFVDYDKSYAESVRDRIMTRGR